MTRRIVERSFDPKQPVLVRRAFSVAGRTFQQGDSFPWSRLSVSVRRARQMFDAGMLIHADESMDDFTDEEPVVTEPVVTEPVVTEPVVTESAETQPPAPPTDNSDLEVDSLVVLQAIAKREGVDLKSTKAAQRQAIIDKRSE